MTENSKIAVYAAAGGNLAIAAAKFTAFAFTGSSALLTEGIHSVVDTGNQGLLLLGLHRAAKPPDAAHPFGHGMELYFWSFVVALMIFALGGAFSVYEGFIKINNPEAISRPWINYLVLGVAILFEAASLTIAVREHRRRQTRGGFLESVRRSKDPSLFAVLLEDSAALIGLFIALVGVAAADMLHMPKADGLASIGIGLLLTAVAVFMANETRSLLTGEAAAPAVVADIRRILEGDSRVARVIEVLSLHFGPNEVLVGVTIDFRDDLPGGEVEDAAEQLSRRIQEAHPDVTRLFLRPGRDGKRNIRALPPDRVN
ncbi:MAG TPA: cation diffusion facilitator family transporter [Caulobacteraceae bacterium]